MLGIHDHRAIGQRLALFHMQEEAQGMVFWHPRGFVLYRLIEEHIRKRIRGDGYAEVRTPELVDRALWEASGHWANFSEHMFRVVDGDRVMAMKPVNCPLHAQIFQRSAPSYRDLPMRLAELGSCHRNEPSGALYGLLRVRNFVQDDAHIFCANEQIDDEVARFCRLLRRVYADFGFGEVRVLFSDRPAVRAGSDEQWDLAERSLVAAAAAAGLGELEHQPGQGAFYGPKLEFVLRDVHGRAWSCGTIQLDLVLPERLDLHYIDPSGQRVRPVMLHRAVLGSLERFVGILLEHHRGALPLWLAPEQVVVAAIAEAQRGYAGELAALLEARGVRAVVDAGASTIARKVVDARERSVPVFWAVGRREAAARAIAERLPDGSSRVLPLAEAIERVAREAAPP
jgi:threonyl-tRNA synthetase